MPLKSKLFYMADENADLFGPTPSSPGEQIRAMLEERGWTQEDLATITGRSRQQIIDLVTGRRGVTTEMAVGLALAFRTSPSFWLNLDAAHRLASTPNDQSDIEARARLYGSAPIREMQKRGWIRDTKKLPELEAELKRFFGVESLDTVPQFPVAFKKTSPLDDLTPTQRAWCFRVREIAAGLPAQEFKPEKMPALKKELRILAAYPAEASCVPDVMRQYGIRYVVVEPLPSSKLDGCAFWIDKDTPVIGMSLMRDRLDNFWFSLLHEVTHIENRDELSVDTDLGVESRGQPLMKDIAERKADEGAEKTLIAGDELDSFIRRIGPIYAKPNIIQFAHRIKIHPAIIVGQLQHRGELGFGANREMLVKVRNHVIGSAVTDGWGISLSPDNNEEVSSNG